MSLRDKIRFQLPSYLIIGVVLSLAVWSLWLPRWLTNNSVPTADALTYSAPISAAIAPLDSKANLLSVAGVYYLAYTSSTDSAATTTCGLNGTIFCNVYVVTSTSGLTWSSPTLLATDIALDDGNSAVAPLGGFVHTTRQNLWAQLYKQRDARHLTIATSSDGGITWVTSTIVRALGADAPSARSYINFATTSNFVAAVTQRGQYLWIATSSNVLAAGDWATSTIEDIGRTFTGNQYRAVPLGVSVEGASGAEKINVVYSVQTSTANGYEIISGQSTNYGLTWTTTTISGPMTVATTSALLMGLENKINIAAVKPSGKLGVLYYQVTAFGPNLSTVTGTMNIIYGEQNAAGAWVTTTLASAVPFTLNDTNRNLAAAALTFYSSNLPIAAFVSTSTNPYSAINTSSFILERISTNTLAMGAKMAVAYATTTQQVAFAYVNTSTSQWYVSTSTLRDSLVNTLPTTTVTNPSFATSGTGYVTVTTTVSDANGDNTFLFVDFSTDNGTTWASSTLVSATGVYTTLTTSTGRVNNIGTNSGGHAISFVWNSQADSVTSTSLAVIRITPVDLFAMGGSGTSSPFTADNVAPSVPSTQTITFATSTASFTWSDSTGAAIYSVSSTAGSATTTTATTTSFTGLTPNAEYSFQVKVADAYNNTSSFKVATSTFIDPVTPTTVAATSNGTTSMIVTWASGGNATATAYQVYNATLGTPVAITSGLTYTVTGLSANTSYQFQVRARYAQDSNQFSSYSSASTAVSTASAGSGSPSSGGGGGSAPSIPAAAVVTAQVAQSVDLTVGQPAPLSVAGVSHTVTVGSATAAQATITLQSDLVTVNIKKGESAAVDTDKDGVADVRVLYEGLVGSKPRFVFTNLTDPKEKNNAFTINAGAYETGQGQVALTFNVPSVDQLAIANTADFAGAGYQVYTKSVTWTLPTGAGTKTVYVKFRTNSGGVSQSSDTIVLVDSANAYVAPAAPTANAAAVSTPTQVSMVKINDLKPGAKSPEVILLQEKLKALGYLATSVKTVQNYGPATTAAVKKFQKANKLPQNGVFAGKTAELLNAGAVPLVSSGVSFKNLRTGSSGSNVVALQEKLKALGFLSASVKSVPNYGPATTAAVKKFQKANNISQTGSIGPLTLSALNK